MQNKLDVTMQIYWADPRNQLWALAQIPKKEKPIFIGTSLSSWNNRERALNIYLFYRVLFLIYLILKQFPCRGTTLPSSLQIPAILFFILSYIISRQQFSLFPLPQTHSPTLTLEEEKNPTQPSIFNKQ